METDHGERERAMIAWSSSGGKVMSDRDLRVGTCRLIVLSTLVY
jgi:hypothetical protein